MRAPLTYLEREMGATEDSPMVTLSCERCGGDLCIPVFVGLLPYLACENEMAGECDAPWMPSPAAWVMRCAGAAPLFDVEGAG